MHCGGLRYIAAAYFRFSLQVNSLKFNNINELIFLLRDLHP